MLKLAVEPVAVLVERVGSPLPTGEVKWTGPTMGFNLQLLFTGIGVCSIYALVALGFALIYRATNVVNFAQGDFAMLGAFAMVVLAM
jgi:ABC-type branched-subunit amino acid transport system permease subunit